MLRVRGCAVVTYLQELIATAVKATRKALHASAHAVGVGCIGYRRASCSYAYPCTSSSSSARVVWLCTLHAARMAKSGVEGGGA